MSSRRADSFRQELKDMETRGPFRKYQAFKESFPQLMMSNLQWDKTHKSTNSTVLKLTALICLISSEALEISTFKAMDHLVATLARRAQP